MRKILLILILLAACVLPQQSSAQVVLKTDTTDVACNASSVFLVPIRVRDFTDVAGLQFTFQWNPAHLDYAYITDINPAFDGIAFDSTTLISQGKFTFAWSQLNSLTLADDAVLLNVAFTRIGGPATVVTFVDDPTSIFAFNGAFAEIPYSIEPGLVRPLDSALPTITCPANITVQGVGMVAVNNIAPASFADDCGAPTVGWSSAGATTANAPNDPDASGALFNVGSSTVVYHATDVVGNTATCSFGVTVEFAVGDDLTFLTDIPPASCGQTIAIDVTAYNFDTIAAFQFSMGWDPALLQYVSISNLNPTLGLTAANFGTGMAGSGQFSLAWDGPVNGTSLPDGTVIFTLNVNVLGSGNVTFTDIPTARFAFSGATFPPEEIPMVTVDASIAVTDNIAPAITCPANVTVQAPGSVAVQNIDPESVLDNCAAPAVGWSSTGATVADFPGDPDASGALFNLGTSTVTYTATDAGGNTDTCTFNVTVEFGAGSTDLTLVANNANAACAGSFFVNVTTLNFNDIAGLQFSMGWDPALIQYTSVSNFNPALGLVQSNFGEGFVGNGQLSFGWTGPLTGTTLNDGEILFRLNFNLLGSTNAAITFTNNPTDIAALAGPAFPPVDVPVSTFGGLVTIVDNVPPTIACPANVTVAAPSGSLTAPVSNLQPTTLADNCGGTPALTYVQSGATTGSGTGNANGNYSAGTTTVVYTGTDGSGNTATCSFSVVVTADAALILHIDTLQTDCQGGADTVKYCITVDNFTDIIGLQFGLMWDTAVLNLLPPATNAYPGLTLNNGMFFTYSTKDDGLLLFFGSILTWPDIPTGDTLFCLNFAVDNPSGMSPLTFQGPFNGVNTSFAAVPVLATNGLFTAGGDNTPPVVTCPPNESVNPPATECNATYFPPLPTTMDACGVVDSITRVPTGNVFAGGVTTITYTVTDHAGNSATCSYELTVTDGNAPQMFNCPANIILEAASDACNAPATWTAPSFNDCSTVTVVNNFFPGDLFPASCSPSTVIYTATDAFNNATTCQFTVSVSDTTLPVLTCPADITVFPVNSCDTTLTYDIPVATDLCDQDVELLGGFPLPGSNFAPGTTLVTWFAADDCGNEAQCTFNVTVVDGAPPVISNCPPNLTVTANSNNCGDNVPWTEPTASDDCDPSVTLTASDQPGSFFVVGPATTVTYTATDDSGNFTTCTFSITVQDLTPPTLSNCPTAPIIVILPATDCDTILNWVAPTAQDNCSQFTLTSNFNPGHNFPTGDTSVVYIVTDASGYADTCSFLVSVRDQVPPVLNNCPPNITVNGNGACKVPATWTEPTATDNCSVATITSPVSPNDSFMVGNTIVQIIAEDASSNYDTCTFTVTVLGVPPGFDLSTLPANVTVSACDTLMTWALPTAIGFCNPSTVTSNPPPPTLFGPGVHLITFTASDGAVSVTATFTITVVEDVDPIMICPSMPVVVNTGGVVLSGPGFITGQDTVAGCNAVELSFALPSATDNCMALPEVSQSSGIATGGVFAVGSHILTFIAEDASGNRVECSVTINVVPLTALEPTADPNPACLNETVILSAPFILGATYTWVKLPDDIQPYTGNLDTIPQLTGEEAGIYTVSANVHGCLTPLDSIEVTLITAPNPQGDVFEIEAGKLDTFNVFDNDNLVNQSEYHICATTPDPLPAGINLLTNGLFSYQEQSGEPVSFTYQICYCDEPGEVATVTIMVKDVGCTFIPNIITPNGDGLNDWFMIPCLDNGAFRTNTLVIYNQWGDKVFEDEGYTNNQNDPNHPAWRGTLNGEDGKDLPDGVYYYIFKPGPNEKPIKGFIEIFR